MDEWVWTVNGFTYIIFLWQMFAVVEWLYERCREVSVVPLSWLIEHKGPDGASMTLCYWPSGNVRKNVIQHAQPPSTDWPTYPVKVLTTEGKITAACC